ncbi:MAG: hypothetical protein EHM39_05250, partial [Chloroflexi bacterium]
MSTPRTLLLFDVDGVLIHPVGYKVALRALVDHFAGLMGQGAMGPPDDEIAVFEACGLTNEWDSGAMCISALLLAAVELRPDLWGGTLDDIFQTIRAAQLTLSRPDFAGIARQIHAENGNHHFQAARYLDMLSARVSADRLAVLRTLLGNVYDVLGTPTTRAFQTYALGSARFAETYGHPAPFETESFLTRYDWALLSDASRARLLDWLRTPGSGAAGNGAAIFTARPSLPPPGVDRAAARSISGYSPEAELAAELLRLDGQVPLIGQGRVSWLASQMGRGVADYIKPSPVQGLAAIGAAASHNEIDTLHAAAPQTEIDALYAAAALYERGDLTGPLAGLHGSPARVIVFEDSVGGISATRQAVERLAQAGLDVTFIGVGVSPNPDKRAALSTVADHLVDDINAG